MVSFNCSELISSYYQTKAKQFSISGYTINYFTKPGFPAWNAVSPDSILLADAMQLNPKEKILWIEPGHGAVPLYLSKIQPTTKFFLAHTNYISHRMVQQSIEKQGIENIYNKALTFDLLKKLGEEHKFDKIVLQIPKGRKFNRRLLAEIHNIIPQHGMLYLSGANNAGVKSIFNDAQQLFTHGDLLGFRKGNRVYRLGKPVSRDELPEWYFMPGIAPGTRHKIRLLFRDKPLVFFSLPGIFSFEAVDEGTELLLRCLNISVEDSVLDFGSGCGILGIVAALEGAKTVSMMDSNFLAIETSKKNCDYHGIKKTSIFPGDGLEGINDNTFSLIVTNPPFHVGNTKDTQITEAFICQSFQKLKPNGRLLLVANKFLPYDKVIRRVFLRISVLHQTPKFRVLEAIK